MCFTCGSSLHLPMFTPALNYVVDAIAYALGGLLSVESEHVYYSGTIDEQKSMYVLNNTRLSE